MIAIPGQGKHHQKMSRLLLKRLFSSALQDITLYHKVADKTLDRLCDNLERLNDALSIPGYDVEYSQGVLTLRLGQEGTFVLNKQPPNRQIWLSSPISGPKRYEWISDQWIYQREPKLNLEKALSKELTFLLKAHVDLSDK